MHKLFAITFIAAALAACSNMHDSRSTMGNSSNPKETKNSSDANKSGNPAAVSPAPGGSSSGAAPAGGGTR